MNEYREIVELPPVIIDREALVHLERLIGEGFTSKLGYNTVKVTHGTRTIRASSVEELLAGEFPEQAHDLDLKLLSWNDQNDIVAGVHVYLHKSYGNVQLHAVDETVFLGKRAQILRFFLERRPWYSLLVKSMPAIAPAVFFGGLFSAAFLVKQDRLPVAAMALVMSIMVAVVAWLHLARGWFPHTRILLTERRSSLSAREVTIFILDIALLVVTIVSIMR